MPKKTKTVRRQTKAEKRIAIAKDVIAQLKAGTYRSSPGTYCEFNTKEVAKMDATKELQKELRKVTACNVCALGSLFVSDVRKHNNFKAGKAELGYYLDDAFGSEWINDSIDDSVIRERLSKLFSSEQLALIETAFETNDSFGADEDAAYTAIEFGQAFDDPSERMTAIMTNIIRNNGTFVVQSHHDMIRASVS